MKKIFKQFKINIKEQLKELIMIILGCLIMALGTAFFLLPNQLSSGGFAGITTITYYLFNLPMGTVMILLNIPLFIIALIKLGKRFFVKAIIGTGMLSMFLNLFEGANALTSDRLLASIYGGIIIGIGTAIILRANASTGGTELLGNIIVKFKPTARTSNMIILIDTIVVALNVIFFKEIEVGLYSAITIYLVGQMIDIIFEGTNFTKMIFIVSDKHKEISEKIGKDIERGSTGIYARGMYHEEDRMLLWCVASRREIAQIREIATKIDQKAFIVISNSREVYGKGFKKWKKVDFM